MNPPIKVPFIENHKIRIDPETLTVGGGWQRIEDSGKPDVWEHSLLRFFLERSRRLDTPLILDIGANTGSFSLLGAINPTITGFAFEPNPQVYRLLKKNLELNKLTDKIQTFPIALSNTTGTAILKIPKSGVDSGLSCVGSPVRFSQWHEIEVPMDRLDAVLERKRIRRLDLIKIDTEGCELLVLQGGEQYLRTYMPDILLEFEVQNTVQFGYHPDEIVKFLTGLGYSACRIGKSDAFFSTNMPSDLPVGSSGLTKLAGLDCTSPQQITDITLTEPVSTGGTPYLSFVVTSRNDTHGQNIHERTQIFMDSLAEQCLRYRLPVELIFVEWNPPEDRPPLRDIFTPPQNSPFFSVRFITVPAAIHYALKHSDILPLFQMIAKNVGIRRARGEFILATNVDILFSEELMAFFAARKLEIGRHYRVDRYDLGVGTVPSGLYGKSLMDYCQKHVVRIQSQWGSYALDAAPPVGDPNLPHTNACGDFALMSRQDWERSCSYPELQLYSLHLDTLGLCAALAVGIKQLVLPHPLCVYHLEHTMGYVLDLSYCESKPHLDLDTEVWPLCSRMFKAKKPLFVNSHWGYAQETFYESSF